MIWPFTLNSGGTRIFVCATSFLFDYLLVVTNLALLSPFIKAFLWYRLSAYPEVQNVLTLLCFLLLLIAFRLCRFVLLGKTHRSALPVVIEGLLYGALTVFGGMSCILTTRLSLNISGFQVAWLVGVMFFLFLMIVILPRMFLLRRMALFTGMLMAFNMMTIMASRYLMSSDEFQPLTSPCVRVVRTLIDGGNINDNQLPAGYEYKGGLLLGKLQYNYLTLSPDENYIFISDFFSNTMSANLHKIRIDDGNIVAEFIDRDYLRDIRFDEETNQLAVAHFRFGNELTFHDVADLSIQRTLKPVFPEIRREGDPLDGYASVQNIAFMDQDRILVTSERGCFRVYDRYFRSLYSRWMPAHPQEIALDKEKRLLAVASLSGYTIATLDLDTLTVLHKRINSFSNWGVALDQKTERVFATALLLGQLVVCREDTLETIIRVPLEPGIRIVSYIAERKLIVVGNYFNGHLYFISSEDYHILGTLFVGSKIRSMAYAPKRDRLYVSTAVRIVEVDIEKYLAEQEISVH